MTIKLRPFDTPTPPPPQLWEGHLRLEQRSDGVGVRAVYPTGEPVPVGNLLTVYPGGLFRCTGVSASLGLPLDKNGRLMLDGEPDYPARIAELEAEVARLTGSEAPPGKGAWQATEEDRKRMGACLLWTCEQWIAVSWVTVSIGEWVREQPPPPPGGGA